MTGEEPKTEHLPVRPSWDCAACGNPWPCAIVKEAMLTEFREHPSVLAIYMSSRLNDAFDDLTADGAQAPPDLYDRFLSWVTTTPRALPAGEAEPAGPEEEAGQPPAGSDDEADHLPHGRDPNDRLPRQGDDPPPSDPPTRSAQPNHDGPCRGGGNPPTRSDPSHCGDRRPYRSGPPTLPRPMDL